MKKTLLAILAAFVAATPLTGVYAADIDYSIGAENNFIVNEEQDNKHKAGDETVGIKVISLGDDKTDSGYIRGLVTGANTWSGKSVFEVDANPTSFEDSLAYELLLEDFNGTTAENAEDAMRAIDKFKEGQPNYDTKLTTPYVKNYNTDHSYLTLPTKDEILSWFENTKVSDTEYKLTNAGALKFAQWYQYSLAAMSIDVLTGGTIGFSGYLTSSYEKTATDILVWVIVPTFNEDGSVKDVTVKAVSNKEMHDAQMDQTGSLKFPLYVMVPVLSFNKEYNCKFEKIETYACYKCDDKYQWLKVGEQETTCTIVSGITSKAKCTDNPKTGVEDYILEFAIAAGICGIVLLAVKRKSLFSRV